MIDILKFIKGAVGSKDFIPSLKHVKIQQGRITAYNGEVALSSPIPIDLECMPQAIPLIKTIGLCEDIVSLKLNRSGHLNLKSGKLTANINCLPMEQGLRIEPEGEVLPIRGEKLLKCLKMIYPFVGSDASRLWSNSVLISKQSAFATNNICLVEYWLGEMFPIEVSLPGDTVNEIIRINEPPISVQMCETNMTFHYEGDRWLRTQLKAQGWPDVRKFLAVESNQKEIPEDLFKGLETIKPFTDDLNRVFISKNQISTARDTETGVSFDVDMLECEGLFSLDMLLLLKNRASSIDLTTWPKPCAFCGDNMRGIIIGMRES